MVPKQSGIHLRDQEQLSSIDRQRLAILGSCGGGGGGGGGGASRSEQTLKAQKAAVKRVLMFAEKKKAKGRKGRGRHSKSYSLMVATSDENAE